MTCICLDQHHSLGYGVRNSAGKNLIFLRILAAFLRLSTECTECISSSLESKGFWRWCIIPRITAFLGFVHRRKFGNRTCLLLQVMGRRHIPCEWLRLALSKRPNKVGFTFRLTENRKNSSFRNVEFPLEFRTIDKVQKGSNSKSLRHFKHCFQLYSQRA
jgi:hypothetical protein